VLESVEAVNKALIELKHDVVLLPLSPTDEIKNSLASLNADLLFNLFEGFCGFPETEALVPDFAEELKIPYTGCPGSVLRLAPGQGQSQNTAEIGRYQDSFGTGFKPCNGGRF